MGNRSSIGGNGGGAASGSNGFHRREPRRSGSGGGTSSSQPSESSPQHTNGHHPRVRFPEEDRRSPGDTTLEEGLTFVLVTISGIFLGGIASICLLGLLTILAILYVGVRPFSVSTYRRVANQLAAASFLDAIALLLPNMKIYLTGDSDVPSPVGTSILVCNHLMDGDWWPILMLGRCVGLRGSVKAILRNEILHLNVQNNNYSSSDNHPSGRDPPRERRSGTQLSPALLKQATAAIMASNRNNGNSHGGYGSPGPESIVHVNAGGNSPSPSSSHAGSSGATTRHHTSRDLKILAKLLHAFMEFPLLNGEDYISDREHLFQLLRSFAENNGAEAPVHLLFFPEGWSLHNGADRRTVLAMSNEFAKREGRPQLKHLLLPKTTGFNASLECLRESSPVVYDVTMVGFALFCVLVCLNFMVLVRICL